MVRIAIVEDDPIFSRTLTDYLHRYEKEKEHRFKISSYTSGNAFLSGYSQEFDLVFMDIQMPGLNGMETARQLRKLDDHVKLIFITTLAQYAIMGYEVGALFYLLKPLYYQDFALKLTAALLQIPCSDDILLRSGKELIRIPLRGIYYVESAGHNVVYHTDHQIIPRRCSLKQAENELDERFVRCSSSFLVNLDHVRSVSTDSVDVGGTLLRISRPQQQTFSQKFQLHQEAKNV